MMFGGTISEEDLGRFFRAFFAHPDLRPKSNLTREEIRMTETWFLAAPWLGLALAATLLSIWLRIATVLSEIVVGAVAQLIIGALVGVTVLGVHEPWIKFLAGTVGKDHVLIRRLRTLTFGSISALFGLSRGIIDTAQYSFLIAAVVASAVVPTLIANAFFLPRHLLRRNAPVETTPPAPAPETGSVAVEKGK
jgi:hypothetical protein